jgi:cysteine desulfurase
MMRRSGVQPDFVFFFAFRWGEKSVQSGEMNASERWGWEVLYFDFAATAPPYDDVVDTVALTMRDYYANPSSLHRPGQVAGMLVQAAREQVAKLLGIKASEVVFTSGGTESNALAIQGVARQFGATRGKHIIVSAFEHPSVEAQIQKLAEDGYEITQLPVHADGLVSIADIQHALREDTILVSVMHVNSEIGSVQPLAEIGALLRGYPKVFFHVDAVQSVGKLPIDMHACGIDLLSASAHKFRGPRGVGLLLVRDGVELSPMLIGGGQESGLRAGTPNTPAIAGMAKALRLSIEQLGNAFAHVQALKEHLHHRLSDHQEMLGLAFTRNLDPHLTSPYIMHLTAPGLKAQVILHALEEDGIIVSSRSACSSRDERPSPTLLAIGMTREAALAGIRISFGAIHTKKDIDVLADAIIRVITRLRKEEK